MARIPEFQSQRFASSLVGTPGEDRSGQILGQAITKAAGQVENTAFSIAVKRQKSMDETLAIKTKTDAALKADALAAQADVDYANFDGPPEERAAQMRAKYEQLFHGSLETVKSPGAKAILDQEFATLTGKYTQEEMQKGRNNQAVLAAKNTIDTVNLLGVQAAELGRNRALTPTQRYMALQGLLDNGEKAYQSGYAAYSVEDRHKLVKQIPESIAKSMLSNMITHSPEDVKSFIDSGQFDKILSPTEISKYREDAIAAIPKVREQQQVEQLASDIGENVDLWNSIVSGDPDALQKIEQSHVKSAGLMKDIVIKGRNAVEDDYAALGTLMGQIDGLYEHNPKTGKRTEISKKTQLEDFQKVLEFAFQAERDGKLKRSTVKSNIDNILVPYYNELVGKRPSGGAFGIVKDYASTLGLWGVAKKAVDYWSGVNKLSKEEAGRVYQDMLTRFNGNDIKTEADAAALAQSAIRNEATRRTPGLATISGTPNKVIHQDNSQSFVQGGKSDVKDAVSLSKGTHSLIVPEPSTGKRYRVTIKDGKPVSKELINA